MRILLDEPAPRRRASMLVGHEVSTVPKSGWAGIKNGRLLALAATKFDVLLTTDRNIEFQQNLAALPVAVLVVASRSNRLVDIEPLIVAIREALSDMPPRSLRKVGA